MIIKTLLAMICQCHEEIIERICHASWIYLDLHLKTAGMISIFLATLK